MNLEAFLHFLLAVIQHQSLTVSIPILHAWSRLLASDRVGDNDLVTGLVPSLLGICTQRLVRWESVPGDSDNPTVVFLNEEIDTIPEKHAFVGNYRRYCSSIIETTVLKRPEEAIHHILNVVDEHLSNLYAGLDPFDGRCARHYQAIANSSSPVVHEDINTAHACRYPVRSGRRDAKRLRQMAISAWQKAAKRCMLARSSLVALTNIQDQQRLRLEETLSNWASSLMGRHFGVSSFLRILSRADFLRTLC